MTRVHWARRGCRGRVQPLLRSEAGSTTIEFAMAIPVVLLLIVGSMITMMGLLAYCSVTYATEMAARYASIHGSMSDAPASAEGVSKYTRAHLWIGSEETRVTTSWSAGVGPGSIVKVSAVLRLPLAVPFSEEHELRIAASSARVVSR